jgi:hypothetical protein
MSRTTILDAVAVVLRDEAEPKSAKQIVERIVERNLFTFKARDPVGVVRAAIRKHLKTHGGDAQPPARLRQVERDRFAILAELRA